jgi:hypothetical protein
MQKVVVVKLDLHNGGDKRKAIKAISAIVGTASRFIFFSVFLLVPAFQRASTHHELLLGVVLQASTP